MHCKNKFNHRVVTMVAERDSGYERFALGIILKLIAQEAAAKFIFNDNTLTTLITSVKESLQMHFIVAELVTR